MKVSWEKTENNTGVLSVEVDVNQVDKALDQAFKKVVKKATVPGFRKGKAPRAIFEKQYGVEVLYQDAVEILFPETYNDALEEANVKAVSEPEIEVEQIEKGQPFIYKATVTVKPEVILGDYKGLAIEEKEFSVSEDDVEKELSAKQKEQAVLDPVEDGVVQDEDRVMIDFEGFVDGVAFEGGKAEKYLLNIGSGNFIPGFEEQLIGMKVNDEKTIKVTFPESYHQKDLAGKETEFNIKLHEIKRPNLPALDDDFAKDISEFETFTELKNDIKTKLEEKAANEKAQYIKNELVSLAAVNSNIDVPQVMIDKDVERSMNQFAQGQNIKAFQEYLSKEGNSFKEKMQEESLKNIKVSLTLEKIAEVENIQISEEEFEAEVKKRAQEMNKSYDELLSLIEERGIKESLKNEQLFNKVMDFLVENRKK